MHQIALRRLVADQHQAFDAVSGVGGNCQSASGRRAIQLVNFDDLAAPVTGFAGEHGGFPRPLCGRAVDEVRDLAHLGENPSHGHGRSRAAAIEWSRMVGAGPGVPVGLGVAENQEAFHVAARYRARKPWVGDNNAAMETVVRQIDMSDPAIAAQVLTLQRSAYRVEADLIGFEQIPPLHESLEDLMAAPLIWFGIVKSGKVVAAIAFTKQDGRIDIDRLVVAPSSLRQGYGTALVASLDPRATITVATGAKNLPAHRLYKAQGFVNIGESSPVAGLQLTQFVRKGNE